MNCALMYDGSEGLNGRLKMGVRAIEGVNDVVVELDLKVLACLYNFILSSGLVRQLMGSQ